MTVLPAGWRFIADFGIRQVMSDPKAIAANVGLGQDVLASGGTLPEYIEAQAKLITGHFVAAKTAGPQKIEFPGAEEACLLMVRHRPEGADDMLHVQTYVRVGVWVGIVTLTTPEAQLRMVRPDYEAFLKGLRILPPGA